jgi:hypothetical protein
LACTKATDRSGCCSRVTGAAWQRDEGEDDGDGGEGEDEGEDDGDGEDDSGRTRKKVEGDGGEGEGKDEGEDSEGGEGNEGTTRPDQRDLRAEQHIRSVARSSESEQMRFFFSFRPSVWRGKLT